MTRILRRPIEVVSTDPDGTPVEFIDQGEHRRVAYVIDRWREMGDWINGEGERHLFQVATDDDAVLDLERAELPPDKDVCNDGESPKFTVRWFIYRVWD